MADETDTPGEVQKPPRRRAPRASSRTKVDAGKSESATVDAAPKRTQRKSAANPEAESKPAAKSTPTKRAPAKPRAAKRQTPATKRRKSETSPIDTATEKFGGKWGAAAIAGGVAVVGAAAAALLSLRGSSRTKPGAPGSKTPVVPKPTPAGGAHSVDGTDASKSFGAGIADENSIPEA